MFSKRSYWRRNKPKQSSWLENGDQAKENSFIPPVQTKLSIGKPGDVYEKEADQAADQVVKESSDSPNVQKMNEEKEDVQSKEIASNVTPLVQKKEEPVQAQEEEEAVQSKEEEEPVQAQEEEEAVQSKEEEEPVQAKEEEEAVQSKEEEEPVQAQKEEEAVQSKEEEESVQAQEEEEAVQSKEKEEAVQTKEEEEAVQSKEEEEPVQAKEEEEAVQSKEEEEPVQAQEEEEAQAKLQRAKVEEMQGKEATESSVKPSIESTLRSKKGSGSKMDSKTRAEMETGFGADFSGVNIHTDSKSQEMSQEIGAQAFTHGNDVYFNQGKYSPRSKEGKHLLAHELTHTIQQGKSKSVGNQQVQRKGKAFRFIPPKSVKRSIKEIQMIVGATPDGIYGPKTRGDVLRYQKLMKKHKKYTYKLDGKWGKHTEAGHKYMAQPRSLSHAAGYNCAGFVLKQWRYVNLADTKAIYSGFKELKNVNGKCGRFEYKIWLWVMKVEQVNTKTGVSLGKWEDFHTVGGRTHIKGDGPKQVMSKNGPRPLEGPGTPMSFEPKTGPVIGADGKPVPDNKWILTNKKLTAYCTKKLP